MQKMRLIIKTNKKNEREAKRAKILKEKWIERDAILLEWRPTKMPAPKAIRKEIRAQEREDNCNN